MNLKDNLTVWKHLFKPLLSPIKSNKLSDRLNYFYEGQQHLYDEFRKKILFGREGLLDSIPFKKGDVWVDFGGGTGYNVSLLKDKIKDFKKIYIVDLCKSLLDVAQKRIEDNGWENVETILADACLPLQFDEKVDVVTFSYSLSMIPNWFTAIDNGFNLLKKDGFIGVVDFYVSRKFPEENNESQKWFTRTFVPGYFDVDSVYPSKDHLPYLQYKFKTAYLREYQNKVLFIRQKFPHYQFIGKKL